MHTRVVRIEKLGLVTIRPLRNGDVETIRALFDRLSLASRARRFNGAKPRLSPAEVSQLAIVDDRSHTIVAYVDGDREPAGIAQLVRDRACRTHAEIAFAAADCYQGRRIGSALVEALAADARAAGITHLTATTQSSNTVAQALVRKVAEVVRIRHEAGETAIVGALQAS
jgi:ribosomal protein S18 acetylase RimI-like enzyme